MRNEETRHRNKNRIKHTDTINNKNEISAWAERERCDEECIKGEDKTKQETYVPQKFSNAILAIGLYGGKPKISLFGVFTPWESRKLVYPGPMAVSAHEVGGITIQRTHIIRFPMAK